MDPQETGAPQHIQYRHHMQHQPRGFASLSGAPQHIWYAYDICTSPAGSPPVSLIWRPERWAAAYPNLRLVNKLPRVLSFFFLIKKRDCQVPFVFKKKKGYGSGPEFPMGCRVQKNSISDSPSSRENPSFGRRWATPHKIAPARLVCTYCS